MSTGNVLLIDDDAAFRFAMQKALRRAGFEVGEAADGEGALSILASGGPLVAHTHYLAERGAKDVTAINIIAAPEGIKYVEEHIDPSIDFKVVVCAVDERLNDKCYIVPGLGDAGDRLYGVID